MAAQEFKLPPGAKVYSYTRCSTLKQLGGDTRRRQLKMSEDWCARHGLELENSLKLHDHGVSAHKGKNATHGRLAVFLKALENGQIVPGSILLVESLDRLSRNEIDEALTLFLGILRRGVTIVTLNPEDVFEPSSKADLVKIIIVLVIMSRAYEESKTKSVRIKEAFGKRRTKARNGEKLSGQKPRWLDANGKPIPAAVKAIKKLFELKRQGKGYDRVARELNTGGYWRPLETGWSTSYVRQRVLGDRRIIGEYQPHVMINGKPVPEGEPIKGYFPAVVPIDVFEAVQVPAEKAKGGQTATFSNVLRNLTKCAYCAGPMQFDPKGSNRNVFYCKDAKRGLDSAKGCIGQRRSINYNDCINALISNCPKLRPRDILPTRNDHDKLITSLRESVRDFREGVAEIDRKTENFENNLGELPPGSVANIKKRLIVLAIEKSEKEVLLAQAEGKLKEAEREPQDFAKWQADTTELLRRIAAPENLDLRERLNLLLKEYISKIEIFTVGHPREYDPEAEYEARKRLAKSKEGKALKANRKKDVVDGITYASVHDPLDSHPSVVAACAGDRFRASVEAAAEEHQPTLLSNKEFLRCVDEVAKLRRTRKGRFLRVHFTTGKTVDIVPAKSLASGSVWTKDDEGKHRWLAVHPDLGKLWAKKRF